MYKAIMVMTVFSMCLFGKEYTFQVATCVEKSCAEEITLKGKKKGLSAETHLRLKGGYIVTIGHYSDFASIRKDFRKMKTFKRDTFMRTVDPKWKERSELKSVDEKKQITTEERPAPSARSLIQVINYVESATPTILQQLQETAASEKERVYRYDCIKNRAIVIEPIPHKHIVIEYDCNQFENKSKTGEKQ